MSDPNVNEQPKASPVVAFSDLLEALAKDFERKAESYNYYTDNKEASAINYGHILAFRESAKMCRAQKESASNVKLCGGATKGQDHE